MALRKAAYSTEAIRTVSTITVSSADAGSSLAFRYKGIGGGSGFVLGFIPGVFEGYYVERDAETGLRFYWGHYAGLGASGFTTNQIFSIVCTAKTSPARREVWVDGVLVNSASSMYDAGVTDYFYVGSPSYTECGFEVEDVALFDEVLPQRDIEDLHIRGLRAARITKSKTHEWACVPDNNGGALLVRNRVDRIAHLIPNVSTLTDAGIYDRSKRPGSLK